MFATVYKTIKQMWGKLPAFAALVALATSTFVAVEVPVVANATIVTNNLVVNLDASNTSSMAASSPTGWKSVSPATSTDTATFFGNAARVSDSTGASMSMDGNGDAAVFPVGVGRSSGSMTVDTWIKPGNLRVGWNIFASRWFSDTARTDLASAQDWHFGIYGTTTTNLKLQLNTGAGILTSTSTFPTVGANKWYHVAFTIDAANSNTATLWINGVAEGTVANFPHTDSATAQLHIGDVGSANTTSLLGNMSRFRIYNAALTSAQIAQNYLADSANYGYSPVNTVAPSVTGLIKVGSVATANAGTWGVGDADGTTTAYQWQSSTDATTWTNISGATSATYTPVANDVTNYLRVNVTKTNAAGNATATSLATLRVQAAAGVSMVSPGKLAGLTTTVPNDATTYNVTVASSNLSSTLTLGTTTGLTFVGGYASTASYMATSLSNPAPIVSFRGTGTAINTALANITYTSAAKQTDVVKVYYATAGTTTTDTKDYIPIYDNGQLTFHYYAYKWHVTSKDRPGMDAALVGLTTTDNVQAPGPWYLATPRYQVEWDRIKTISGLNSYFMGAKADAGSTNWYWPASTDGFASATTFGTQSGTLVTATSTVYNQTNTTLPFFSGEPNGGTTIARSGYVYVSNSTLGWDDVPADCACTTNFVMETFGTAPFNTGAAGVLAQTVSTVTNSFDAPTGFTVTPSGTGSVVASWNAVTANTTINPLGNYKVEYSTSANFSPLSSVVAGSNVTSAIISGLTANTTYYFRVFGIGPTSGQPWGVASTAVSATTLTNSTTITVVSTGGGVAGTDYTNTKGIIFPKTGTSVSVNASDIQTSLSTITTILAADNVVINAPITWSTSTSLQLGAGTASTVAINKTITVAGASQLTISPATYSLDVKSGASIQFTSASAQYLYIGGTNYTLLKTEAAIAALASTTGNYAIAKPIPLANTYTVSPIAVAGFAGTIDGLGNTVSGLKLNAASGGSGFVQSIAGGTIRNLGVTNITNTIGTTSGIGMGGVVGNSGGGTLEQVWSTGSIKAVAGSTISALGVGGILGNAYGGTTTITKSWSSVNIDTSAVGISNLIQGGIIGGDVSTYGSAQTNATAGGNVTLNQVYSLGDLKWAKTLTTWHGVGGVMGLHFSSATLSMTDVFGWSSLYPASDAYTYNYGGIIGVSQTGGAGTASTFTRNYTSYSTCTAAGQNAVASACTTSVIPGSAVSAMTGSTWTTDATYGTYLTNVAPPVKTLYVQVLAPSDGSYSGIGTQIVDSFGNVQTLSSLNLSKSGTPTYSIASNAARATYPSVTYSTGLTLGGTAAGAYSLTPWATGTSVTISRLAQTLTWSPTTSISFGAGTFTPSAAPTSSAGSTITYSVASAGTTGCTVNSSTGAVSYTSSGSCAITATAAQTTDYTAATVTVTFVIAAAAAAPSVTTAATSTTSLLVSWNAPTVSATSGSITGYQILYSTSADMSGAVTVNTGNTNTSRLFTGLGSGTTYYFQVRAVSGSAWTGAFNTAVTGTPKVAATTITVVASGGGVLGTDYKISNGTVYTANASASVNVADIQTALATGGVVIAAENIVVNTAISWTSNQTLTLGTSGAGSLDINDSITASGASAGLIIASTSYNLKTQTGAEIILSGASSTLSMGGQSYTLIRTVSDLSSVTATGFYALAQPIPFTTARATSPINVAFTGTFDGLGNNVDNMKINPTADGSYGFFSSLNGATVRNLGVTTAWTAINSTVSLTKISAGILAGESAGSTSLTQVWTTGQNTATMGTITRYTLGGLIGAATGGTLTVTKSWSSVSLNSNGATITYIGVGGLVGSNQALVGEPSTTAAGGSIVMNQVYSTGNIFWATTGPGHRAYGGLLGLAYSSATVQITDAFSWSPMRNVDVNYSGLIGYVVGGAVTITRAYTTNAGTVNNYGTYTPTSVSGGITLGANVATLNTASWTSSGTSKLVNLPDPFRPAYVVVGAPTDGSYSTISYSLVDGLWANALTSPTLTTTGTPVYTIAANVANGTYNVDYVSGLTLGGTNAAYYKLFPWVSSTSVTISKQNQNVTWAPTTSVNFGSGTFTADSAPVASGGTAITYAVSSAGTTGCTVNSTTGAITAIAAGSCAITATAAGTTGFLTASATVTFVIADAAAAPTSVTVSGASTNSVLVSWTAPTVNATSGSITGYQLLYSTSSSMTSPTTINTGNTNTSRLVTGLTSGTTYFFQVRAVSGSAWTGALNTAVSGTPKASATTITVVASGGGTAGTDYKLSNGVIYPTGTTVSVNAADIQSALLTSGVTLAADNVVVNTSITWTTSQVLTLGTTSGGSLALNDSLLSSGASGGVVITPTSYSLKVNTGAEITLSGASSSLSIGGTTYTLIHSTSDLSSVAATGNYALANPITYSTAVAALTASPINQTFTGTFDGLGNSVDRLNISGTTAGNYGLFNTLGSGGTIRNLGVTSGVISLGANNYKAGLLAGGSTGGTIDQVWSSGLIKTTTTNTGSLSLGGLVGNASAGTLTISKSWSSANINSSSTGTTTALEQGGIIGGDEATVPQANSLGGAIVNLNQVYATGTLSWASNGHRGIGGLFGLHYNSAGTQTVTDSFSWVTFASYPNANNMGGIFGVAAGTTSTVTRAYQTTTTACVAGGSVGFSATPSCDAQQTAGSTVTGISGAAWTTANGTTLANVATPAKPLYVKVNAPGNLAYNGITYSIVDGTGTAVTLSNLNLSVTGTPVYTITSNVTISATAYKVDYVSGLTLGGTAASLYSLSIWPEPTSITISKYPQTVTWTPTTSIGFGSGTATPTAATASGGTTITYSVTNAGTTGCTVNSTTGAITYNQGGSCQITATAANSGNYLEATDVETFVIAEPATASTLTLARTGTGALSVGWTAPTVNSSVTLTGYQVQYSTSASMTSPTTVNVGNTRGYLLTGLTNGTTYYFQVRAVSGTTWYSQYSAVASAAPAATATTINVVASGGGVAGTDYTVNGGVISTTGTASINAADINTILVNEGTVQLAADTVNVNSALTWSTSSLLVLGNTSSSAVNVNSTITGSGVSSGVKILRATYGLLVKSGAYIRLTGASATFNLGGTAYTVVNTLAGITNIASGSTVAITAPITLTATYTRAVRDVTFTGTLDGLGNTVNNMTIAYTATGNFGFFNTLSGATVRNIGFTNVNISSSTASIDQRLGAVAGLGCTAGTCNVTQVWATGFLSQNADTGKTEAGGIFGGANGGTLNLSKSWSSVSVTTNSPNVGSGGIIGTNTATIASGGGTGNTLNISEVYSTGNIKRVGPTTISWYGNGGIIGVAYGAATTITNSFSWGNINSTGTQAGTSTAGIVGVAWSSGVSTTNSYTTNASCGGGTVTNCVTGATAGAALTTGTGFTSGVWQSVNGTSLTNLTPPTKSLYVQVVAPTNGAYETMTYQIVDSTGVIQTPSTLGITVSGTPVYTITSSAAKATYSVAYVSGLSLGGASASVYSLNAWITNTSVTISKLPQSMTWSPTTSIPFKNGSFTPSLTPTVLGTPTITYAVTSAGTTGCTVNSSTGVISYTSAGTCAVTASAAEYTDYTAASAAVSFVIGAAPTITVVASGGGVSGTDYTIAGGVLSAASDVNVNAGDLATALASGSVQLGGNVIINAPITWSANTVLTLGGTSTNSVSVNRSIAGSGNTAGIVIKPSTYALSVKDAAAISLSGTTPTLSIGGNSYTLIKSIAELANVTATAGTYWALAVPLTFTTGKTAAPINVTFTGTFDGLGNTVDKLAIVHTANGGIGFFKGISGATIRNLGITNETISLEPASTGYNQNVGGLAGDAPGGTLDQVWTTGHIRVRTGSTYGGLILGGLVGDVYSGTLTVTKSWSSMGLNTWGSTYTAQATGGLVGANAGTLAATSTSAGGSVTISQSYFTGDIQSPQTTGLTGLGGIMGAHIGTGSVSITDSFSWGAITISTSGTGGQYGGILGTAAGSQAYLYTTFTNTNKLVFTGANVNTNSNSSWSVAYGATPGFSTNAKFGVGATGFALVNLPTPYKNYYYRVIGPTDGSYSTITYKFVNGTDTVMSMASFSVTGTPTYTIASDVAISATPYNVDYSSGLTVAYTGAGVDVYRFVNYGFPTAVTISKYSQTISLTSTAPATAAVGATYTLTGSASSSLTVAYSIDSASSSVCSISGSVVTYNALGTCTINANQAGNTSYNAAPQVQQSTTVDTKGTQTVSFSSTAPSAKVGGATYTPTGSATSGLTAAITVSSGSSSICAISSGVVSFSAVGNCVLNINQAGTANWNPATQVQQTVTVSQGDQTISFTSTKPSGAVVGGTSYTPSASSTSNGTVVFTIDSGSSAVCSIASGVVTFQTVGTCKVLANQAGNTNWNAAPENYQSFAVAQGTPTLAFTSTASAPKVNTNYTPVASSASTGSITYTIDASASSICSISSGVVSFNAVGTCKVNANQVADSNWIAAVQAQQSITVARGDQAVSITSSATSPKVGTSYTVNGTVTSGGTITYSVTTPLVCTIASGVVSFIAVGDCIVKGDSAATDNWNAATQASQTIAVIRGDQSISFTTTIPNAAKVNGSTYTVGASGGASGKPVTYSIDSASTTVCSISGTTVTFLTKGTCVVLANQDGTSNYNAAAEVSQSIAVAEGSQAINFTSTIPNNAVVGGTTYTVTATGGNSGKPVTFNIASASAEICEIASGVVTFLAVGDCVVEADQAGNANYLAATQVTQTISVGKGTQVILFTSTVPNNAVVDGSNYTVAAAGGQTGNAVVYSVALASSGICTIASDVVTFIGAGDCVVEANQLGDDNWNDALQVTQTIPVGKGAQVVTFSSVAPSSVRYADAGYSVSATGGLSSSPVVISIASSSAAVCSISSGVVTYDGVGTCLIEASQAGDDNYNAAETISQRITVSKALQTLNWTSTAPLNPVVDGAKFTPMATGGNSGESIVYSIASASSAICNLAAGEVSFTAVGDCEIQVNQAGNANYEAAQELTLTLTVGKGSQAISFTTNAPSSAIVSGARYTPQATGGATGHAVVFSIDINTASVCAITAGEVRFVGVGTCTVNANQSGDANYLSAPVEQQSFSVAKGSQAILFTSTVPSSAIVGGAQYTPTATGGLTGNSVTFSIASSSSAICLLNAGKVSFTTPGDCVIEANQAGNSNYNAASTATQIVTVAKGSQFINFTSSYSGANVGGNVYKPVATGGVSGKPVAFSIASASSSVCSITNGEVSFTAVGECVIEANQDGNSNYNPAPMVSQTVAVAKGTQVVMFTSEPPHNAQVQGLTYIPTAIGSASGIAVVFSVPAAAQQYCTISGGVVSFHAVGNCVLYADQAGDSNWNAATRVSQIFDVTKGNQSIAFSSTAPSDAKVAGSAYTVAAGGGNGTASVTYAISELSLDVCSVTGDQVTFQAPGECFVVASKDADSQYNAANPVVQSFAVAKGIQVLSFVGTASAPTVDGAAYVPNVTSGGSTAAVVYSSADATICEVAAGVVYFHKATDCTIYADQPGDENFEAATQISQTFAIAKGSQLPLEGHSNLTTLTLGGITQPNTAISVSGGSGTGAYVWSVNANSTNVCSITDDIVTGYTAGYCVVDLQRLGDDNYNDVVGVLEIVVSTGGQAPVRTVVSDNSPTYAPGLTVDLSLTGGDGDGAIWFESATPHVCNTVDDTVLEILHAGSCTVIGHKDGDGNFQSAQNTVTFTIAKAIQSSVTISVANRLTYPVVGSVSSALVIGGVLSSGVQTLSVTTGTCTIENGELVATLAGDCVVRLQVDADENYEALDQSATIHVAKAQQSNLTATRAVDAPVQIGIAGVKTTTYEISGGSGNGSLVLTANTPSKCSASMVDGTVVVTGIAPGACSVSIEKLADANFEAATANIALTVLDLPAAPTAFTLTNTGESTADGMQVRVGWTPAALSADRAVASGYKIQLKVAGVWTTIDGGLVDASQTSLLTSLAPWTKVEMRVAAVSPLDPSDESLLNWKNFSAVSGGVPTTQFAIPGDLQLISTSLAAVTSGEIVTLTGTGFAVGVTTLVELSSSSSVFTAGLRTAAVANTVRVPATVLSPTTLTFVLPKIKLPAGATYLNTTVRVLSSDGITSEPADFKYIPAKLKQTLTVAPALPASLPNINVGAAAVVTTPVITNAVPINTSGAVAPAPTITTSPAGICSAALNADKKLVVTPIAAGKCTITVAAPATPGLLAGVSKTTSVTIMDTRTTGFNVTARDVTDVAGTQGESRTFSTANTNLVLPGVLNVVIGANPLDIPVTLSARQGTVLFTVATADDAAGLCSADGGDATSGLLGSITISAPGDCHITISQPLETGWYAGETIYLTIRAIENTTPVTDNGEATLATSEDLAGVLDPKDPDDPETPPVAMDLDPTRAGDYSFGSEDGLMYDPVTGKLNVRSRTPLVGVWTATLTGFWAAGNATKPNPAKPSSPLPKFWFRFKGKVVKGVQQYTYSNVCKLTLTVKKDPKLKKKVTRIVGAGCELSEDGKAALTATGIQKIKVKYKRIRQYAKTGLSYVKSGKLQIRKLKNINRTWIIRVGRRN